MMAVLGKGNAAGLRALYSTYINTGGFMRVAQCELEKGQRRRQERGGSSNSVWAWQTIHHFSLLSPAST